MSLPFTIREQILQHLRPVQIIRALLPGFNGPRPTPIQLLITAYAGDKTLRLETIRTTLLSSQLEIHLGPANRQLQQWLASLDFSTISADLQDGFDVVRKLSFPYSSRFPRHLPQITSNQDINLMKKYRQLKQVCIQFVAEEVVRGGVEKTADQLVREYYLDRMLDLDELEILEFSGHCTQDTEVGVYATALWFKRQFDQRKYQGLRSKEVKVVLPRGLVVDLDASAALKNELHHEEAVTGLTLAITSNDDIDLMLKCKGLKSVAIAFHPGNVICMWGTGVLGPEMSADELVRDYYLDNMLDLNELEELQFLQYCGRDPSLGIPALARWFKNGHQQRKESGQRVKAVRVLLPDGTEA